ncbi:hypothetical protein, partial [Ralstonia pseudosolanacearum]|uniref:hypothetical protein n=1 Tax=Ralstonia pseudosolanacearum TaxID=1310165 RepID=UPI002010CFE1
NHAGPGWPKPRLLGHEDSNGARRDNVEPIQYLEYLRFDLLNIFWRPSSNFRIRSCFASRAA